MIIWLSNNLVRCALEIVCFGTHFFLKLTFYFRYAVNLEEGDWQRAKILDIEEETATVFLGDHGDDDIVSLKRIKILEPQFRKLPAQVCCML